MSINMSIFKFDAETHEPSLLVFGYGSLIWNPGFEHDGSWRAILPGYARRFYHGNSHHRGTVEQPGRVATLIRDPASLVSGLVFHIKGLVKINAALKHLHYREIDNGYKWEAVNVVHMDGDQSQSVTRDTHQSRVTSQSVTVLTCIAHSDNEEFMGHASDEVIGGEIARAKGLAGPNSEYAFKLADAQRQHFPELHDEHLFGVEAVVRRHLKTMNGDDEFKELRQELVVAGN